MLRADPAGVVWREAAGSKHAVDMGMVLQALIPGMEHAEEADLRAKVPGIASDLKQSLSASLKQEAINQLLVLESKRSKLAWQREDDMNVGVGRSSRSRASSQRWRALPWHLGQCRLRHEL